MPFLNIRVQGAVAVTATHVFLIAGQSNAEDHATYDSGALYPTGAYQYTQGGALSQITTSYLDHPSSDGSDMGFSLQFVIDYMAANPTVEVVLVPEATNGTAFGAGAWGVGNTLSDNAISRTNAVMAANPAFEFKGVLWLQGESSLGSTDFEADQEAQFAAFRTITGASANTPILVGQMAQDWVGTDTDKNYIQNIITDTPNRVPFTALIETTGLSTSDGLHFDSASVRTLGSRYYSGLASLDLVTPAPSITNPYPASTFYAITPEQMVFNGSDVLTGFTTDVFGNSARTTITGTLQKGPNGGVLINDAQLNYLTTVLSEVSGAYPTGHHLSLCYRRTESRTDGLLIGSTNNATTGSFIGSMRNDTSTTTTFDQGSVRNYVFDFGAESFELERGTSEAQRGSLYSRLYSDNEVKCVGLEDARMGTSGGSLRWFRFDDLDAQFHGKVELFGWAMTDNNADLIHQNKGLQRECIKNFPIPVPVVPPTYIGTTSSQSGVVALPAGLSVGDTAIVFFGGGDFFDTISSYPYDAGWTLYTENASSSGRANAAIFWRTIDGTEPATASFGNGYTGATTTVVAYSGLNATAPIANHVSLRGASNVTAHPLGSLSVSDDNTTVLGFAVGGWGGNYSYTSPAGWTELSDIRSTLSASDGNVSSVAEITGVSAGSLTGTFTCSTGLNYATIAAALQPA